MATKRWTEQEIVDLLARNDAAVERAIIVLYRRQTSDEQVSQTTREHNARGFSAFDAKFMSSLAEWILKGRNLSDRQLAAARKVLPKYRKQLVEEANNPKTRNPEIPTPVVVPTTKFTGPNIREVLAKLNAYSS